MNILRFVCQRNVRQMRQFHKCIVQQTEEVAATISTPTESMEAPITKQDKSEVDSKIEHIASQIVSLTLIEVAELSELLKKRLNLSDATIMPMQSVAAVAPSLQEEPEEPPIQQTSFTIKLKSFDNNQKIALIKTMKTILPDCNLVQAKKFVEGAPAVIKSNIPKNEAEEIKQSVEKSGGTIEIV